MTPGQEFIILTTSDAPKKLSYYDDGVFIIAGFEQAADDAYFTATFDAPLPAAVPTLSEWAMILLAVALAGGAALMIQRRHRAV